MKAPLQIALIVIAGLIGVYASIDSTPTTTKNNANQQANTNCQVVINEFVSAKQTHLKDEDGDYPDWVELYNCQNQDINLKGWALSDNEDKPQLWTFPDVTIKAKSHLVVFASGKNKTKDPKALHTNFKIDATGEALFLSDHNKKLIDSTPAIALEKNLAIGRYPDGSPSLFYYQNPTPNKSNSKSTQPYAVLDPVEFSHESGFYEKEFNLTLSHPDSDTTIYYTLDGSDPDPDNLGGSTYRYKNSYAQPPKPDKDGKITPLTKEEIEGEFLYNEYKTHQYSKAIPIKDRTYEPDRISQISTTFDKEPNYFPKPEKIKKDSFKNKTITFINKGINKYNHLRNRASRKWHKIKTSEIKPLGNKEYIKPLAYDETLKYTYKGTPLCAPLQLINKDNIVTFKHIHYL